MTLPKKRVHVMALPLTELEDDERLCTAADANKAMVVYHVNARWLGNEKFYCEACGKST